MSPKILVVEDKAIIAKDIQNTLEELGYSVPATASSGQKALEKAAEHRPDLVLMDIRLKGDMDGITAAGHIRARFDIPVIYLTAHADSDTLDRAKMTEPFGYVFKPFEEKDLRVAVEMALYKHQIERKLKDQERWLSATLESIGDAVLTADMSNRVISMNRAAQILTGWSLDEAHGRSATEIFKIVDEKTHESVQSPLTHALQAGTAAGLPYSTLLITKDGAEILVGDIATPIRDEQDIIIGGVLIFRDISRDRLLEERMHQAQKMEAAGQLAAGIAHNFNNMLTTIIGYANLAALELPANHAAQSDLQNVQKTSWQAAEMVQQLLGFTRRQIIQPKVLDLNDLLRNMDKMLRGLLPEAIELELLLDPNLGEIKVDRSQVEQVLVNLVLNARDAMPEAGQLTLQTAIATLDQTYTEQYQDISAGQYVLLNVIDNGNGMDEQILRHIFEPFFTTKEIGQGTGLGLSTCLGIVKQNHGHITVESKIGRGTTFKVYWPIVETALALAVNEAKVLPMPTGNETILVVEDETQLRALITTSLQRYGYTVLETTNGEQALHVIKSGEQVIHLLITDVVMPLMGGRVLARQLKEIYPNLKVLFISGYMDTAVVPDGTAFLQKPFTLDGLARKARETLDGTI